MHLPFSYLLPCVFCYLSPYLALNVNKGIAPTVMVARVSLSANHETDIWLTANARKTATLRFDKGDTSGSSETNADQSNTRVIDNSDIEKDLSR